MKMSDYIYYQTIVQFKVNTKTGETTPLKHFTMPIYNKKYGENKKKKKQVVTVNSEKSDETEEI